MNRTNAILAAALAALSGAAFANTGLAGDITIETRPFVSTRTRAEVRTELDAYKKSGVNPWSLRYNPLAHFKSGKTRAEVIADYHIWRLAGLQDLTRGELSADTNSYQYRMAYATYLHLRQSPQFAELVSELQKRPNALVVASPLNPPAHAAN